MKKLLTAGIFILFASACVPNSKQTQPQPTQKWVDPYSGIPELLAMPEPERTNIRKTCHERWALDEMNIKTFHVRPDHSGYLITCESLVDGDVYLNTIRTDKQGNWINDGRTKKNP